MPRVITNGKIKIGAYRFRDEKKIALCVEEDDTIVICGYFSSEDSAMFFMEKLGECVGAEKDTKSTIRGYFSGEDRAQFFIEKQFEEKVKR